MACSSILARVLTNCRLFVPTIDYFFEKFPLISFTIHNDLIQWNAIQYTWSAVHLCPWHGRFCWAKALYLLDDINLFDMVASISAVNPGSRPLNFSSTNCFQEFVSIPRIQSNSILETSAIANPRRDTTLIDRRRLLIDSWWFGLTCYHSPSSLHNSHW